MKDAFTIARDIAASPRYLQKNIIAEKGLSIRYLFYRVARPILKLKYKVFKWRNPRTPWTAEAAVAIFRALLTKNMTGLEYGSGNSTLFFAEHMSQLVSVEHDRIWYDHVRKSLDKLHLANVGYRLIPPAAP